MITVKIKTNFNFADEDKIVFLTINNKHTLVKKQLKSKDIIEARIDKSKEYVIELSDETKVYKKLTLKSIDGSLIKIITRKSPPSLGLRGKLFELIMKPFLKSFTFKIKKWNMP